MKKIKKRKDALITLILVFIALFIWEMVVRKKYVNVIYTSSPTNVIKDIVGFYKSGELFKNVSITLKEAIIGLFIGTGLGVIVALILGYFKSLGKSIEPIITMLHSIPQLALAPVYIMWFGIGETSKIFISTVMVFFLVFFATYGGIKSMESRLEDSAALLGANNFQILMRITLPSCTPWIISGVRSGVGAALIGAIVGEYLGASSGIGWMISSATSYYNMTRVMSMLLVLLILGGIMNKILSVLERKLLKYKEV